MRILVVMIALAPLSAQAEKGWVCTEDGNVQKYRVAGQQLIAEGDAATRMIQADNKSLGLPIDTNISKWTIVTNNYQGIVAISSEAVRTPDDEVIYADVLMIDKVRGRFRHVSNNVSFKMPIQEVKNGSCTDY